MSRRDSSSLRPCSLAVALMGLTVLGGSKPAPAHAATCNVPSDHATLGAALGDAGCSEIVLAAGTFAESADLTRDLVLRGAGAASSVVGGRVRITGATKQATLQDLAIDTTGVAGSACFPEALVVGAGAAVETSGVEVREAFTDSPVCSIFRDGFGVRRHLGLGCRLSSEPQQPPALSSRLLDGARRTDGCRGAREPSLRSGVSSSTVRLSPMRVQGIVFQQSLLSRKEEVS